LDRIYLRLQKNNFVNLKRNLLFETWDDVYRFVDANLAYRSFYNTLISHIDNWSSSCTVQRKNKMLKPWMNRKLMKLINKREKIRLHLKKIFTAK
jgi:hypothetical protein